MASWRPAASWAGSDDAHGPAERIVRARDALRPCRTTLLCPLRLRLQRADVPNSAETDSPRGRIALIDAMSSGRAEPTAPLLQHLDRCLQCRACETACPSGVQFGRIMARAHVMEGRHRPAAWRLRAAALRQMLLHPKRLRALMAAMRIYARSPLPAALRAPACSLPGARGRRWRHDATSRRPVHAADAAAAPHPRRRFDGCVMPHLYPRTHASARAEPPATAPSSRPRDAGGIARTPVTERPPAARRNADAFLDAGVEAVIVDRWPRRGDEGVRRAVRAMAPTPNARAVRRHDEDILESSRRTNSARLIAQTPLPGTRTSPVTHRSRPRAARDPRAHPRPRSARDGRARPLLRQRRPLQPRPARHVAPPAR
jgi:ferredoxin